MTQQKAARITVPITTTTMIILFVFAVSVDELDEETDAAVATKGLGVGRDDVKRVGTLMAVARNLSKFTDPSLVK